MSENSSNLCVDIDWSDHWRIDNGMSAAANGQTHAEQGDRFKLNLQRRCFLKVAAFGTDLFIPPRLGQDTIQDMFDLAHNGHPIWLGIQDEYYE